MVQTSFKHFKTITVFKLAEFQVAVTNKSTVSHCMVGLNVKQKKMVQSRMAGDSFMNESKLMGGKELDRPDIIICIKVIYILIF